MKISCAKQFLFKVKPKPPAQVSTVLTGFLTELKEALCFEQVWTEVAMLNAYIKKSKPVFRGTPYFAKLEEVLRKFRRLDELSLPEMSNWFVSLCREGCLPCKEVVLLCLLRMKHGCIMMEELFPVLLKTAKEFIELGQLGHYPSTVVFALSMLGSLKSKAKMIAEVLGQMYNQVMSHSVSFPQAGRTIRLAEELLARLPASIEVVSEESGIKLELETTERRHIISLRAEDFIVLPAEEEKSDWGKEKQIKDGAARKKKTKRTTQRKLSLFDQMQYTGSSSQAVSSKYGSEQKKDSSQATEKSTERKSRKSSWESWFKDPPKLADTTPKAKKKRRKQRG